MEASTSNQQPTQPQPSGGGADKEPDEQRLPPIGSVRDRRRPGRKIIYRGSCFPIVRCGSPELPKKPEKHKCK